jgi:hypothetical protein
LRQRRLSKSERTIALRSQTQQARVQLSYYARNRCASVRSAHSISFHSPGTSKQSLVSNAPEALDKCSISRKLAIANDQGDDDRQSAATMQ